MKIHKRILLLHGVLWVQFEIGGVLASRRFAQMRHRSRTGAGLCACFQIQVTNEIQKVCMNETSTLPTERERCKTYRECSLPCAHMKRDTCCKGKTLSRDNKPDSSFLGVNQQKIRLVCFEQETDILNVSA